jgi:hypothetical protein
MYNNDELFFIEFTHTVVSLLQNQCDSRIFLNDTDDDIFHMLKSG